jgi:hypothetical protein
MAARPPIPESGRAPVSAAPKLHAACRELPDHRIRALFAIAISSYAKTWCDPT